MKKAFSILLITVLIFSIAGYEIIFSVMLYQYKEEGKSIISSGKKPENEVVLVINSSNKDLFERENDYEVKFKGIMYDIRKEEKKGNDLILYAVMDVNEQSLVNNLRLDNKNEKSGNHSKAQLSGKDFSVLYLIPVNAYKKSDTYLSKIHLPSVIKYSQPDNRLNTPPPRLLIV